MAETDLKCIYKNVNICDAPCGLFGDATKSRANRLKHGVSFETARFVFDDPFHVSVPDRHEHGEERWTTIGLVGSVTILVVAHTYGEANGEEIVRIVSARKATKGERRRYQDEH